MQICNKLIMNVLRSVTILVLSVVFLCPLGCGKQVQSSADRKRVSVIAINQYAPHPILDAVCRGLTNRLSQVSDIKVIIKNANGDRVICQQINEQFVGNKVAVIVALGTPAAQSAVATSKGTIPVVFGAITDPVGAKLADSMARPGGNKTGTTNRWPFRHQVDLIHKLFPEVRKVGVLVNPAEANCESGMVVIRQQAKEAGLTLVEVPITGSMDVVPAVESLRGKVEILLISPSNDLYSALDAFLGAASRLGLPVLGGDESAVKRGSLATYGFSNEAVGESTAECVLLVLKGDRLAGDIPVVIPPRPSLFLNRNALEKAHIQIPSSLSAEI